MVGVNTGQYTARLERRSPGVDTARALTDCGWHPLAAKVLANRLGDNAQASSRPALSCLSHPDGLPDMATASETVARAVMAGEPIALVTDHDVDGVSAHAILSEGLVNGFGVPLPLIQGYIGLRLKDGYGVSDAVVDRILAAETLPRVVITADCGSSDEPRIARLAEAGCRVVVTDHHELGFTENEYGEMVETPPPSAVAVVNPARSDSQFGDRMICGAMVAWLLMCAVRLRLIEMGHLSPEALSHSLSRLLDFVALGTVADCVSLGQSINNRAVVRHGLKLIAHHARPCFRQTAGLFIGKNGRIGAQDLAFGLAPRINACGRLGDAMVGVEFMLSKTDADAASLARRLDAINTERKGIQDELTEVALIEAELACDRGDKGLALWLAAGHPGVHGIVASRVLERFARPVICLSPHANNPDLVTGSARAPEGVHIRDIFESIHRTHPGLLTMFGGHAAAGGLTLAKTYVDAFCAAFRAATQHLDDTTLVPAMYSDGDIGPHAINDALIGALDGLEPYGRGFDVPAFEADFMVMQVRQVGVDQTHLQVVLQRGGRPIKGIWFSAVDDNGELPLRAGKSRRLLFTPQYNEFNGTRSIQLVIKGAINA